MPDSAGPAASKRLDYQLAAKLNTATPPHGTCNSRVGGLASKHTANAAAPSSIQVTIVLLVHLLGNLQFMRPAESAGAAVQDVAKCGQEEACWLCTLMISQQCMAMAPATLGSLGSVNTAHVASYM